MKRAVENIDFGVMKIGGIEEVMMPHTADGKSFVDGFLAGVIHGDDRARSIDGRIPTEDRASFRAEKQRARAVMLSLADDKVLAGSIQKHSGGRLVNVNCERERPAIVAINTGEVRMVLGHDQIPAGSD